MTFEIIVVAGVISWEGAGVGAVGEGWGGQNCGEDLSKLLCQLLFICDQIARGGT